MGVGEEVQPGEIRESMSEVHAGTTNALEFREQEWRNRYLVTISHRYWIWIRGGGKPSLQL